MTSPTPVEPARTGLLAPSEPALPEDLSTLDEPNRALIRQRWQVLAPIVQDGRPVTEAAAAAGVPLRTVHRWLADYRTAGLTGLGRRRRSDHGTQRTPPPLIDAVHTLARTEPRLSVAAITRHAADIATIHGWTAPGYSTVREILARLDL